MSLIKKANELNIQSKIKALIYGQPGTGKTTLALSAPKPLLFDFDNGVHRVNFAHLNGVDTVQVSSYQDFLDVLEKEDLTPYETLVIDTGGKCLDFMGDYIIKSNSKMGKANGTLTLQGYGERKAEFSALNRKISSLDKHVIYVAHRETKTEGDDTRYVPQFGGSNYDSLVTELDLVGYLEANGRDRVITFDPTSRNDGKNTCNLPSAIKVPVTVNESGVVVGKNTFFSDFVMKSYAKRLEVRQEQINKYDALMKELEHEIILIHDADSANDFVGRIDAFEHIGNSKAAAGQLLAVHVKKLGLTFDKEAKKYTAPANAQPSTNSKPSLV